MITKWYEFITPKEIGDKITNEYDVIRLTNKDIIKEYYSYWKASMLKKYSYVDFMTNFTIDDCIEDFVIVNWAYEVQPTEKEKEQNLWPV